MVCRKLSIAPMMACTDRHFRYLMRLITQETLLYTEMVTANALVFGDRARLLACDVLDTPVAIQLGGSDPAVLARVAVWCEQSGYAEINLNVGCPSDRVQSGGIGACLYKTPDVVARCVQAMQAAVAIPVTVKTRIGVDEVDDYGSLRAFVDAMLEVGCSSLTFHARKAWLTGLSPKQNRTVPPLNYDRVYQLKQDYPQVEVIMNGGIRTHADVATHLAHVDGVMLGREAYHNPYWFADADERYFNQPAPAAPMSRAAVLSAYWQYAARQAEQGESPYAMVQHALGVLLGQPGARQLRNTLCVRARGQTEMPDISDVVEALSEAENSHKTVA